MKIQIAKIIFLSALGIMKKILELAEFKMGKQSDEYKYFRSQVMDHFYNGLKELFLNLQENKQIEKCSCNASLRQGFSDCKVCSGSGYKNIEN